MTIAITQNDIVEFQLIQPGIVGDKFKDVTIVGTFGYDIARINNPEIATQHVALYPYFKSKGIANNPSSYDYIAVKDSYGTVTVIGVPWINESTYKSVSTRVYTIVIQNFNVTHESAITDLLGNLGCNYSATLS